MKYVLEYWENEGNFFLKINEIGFENVIDF